MRVFISLIMTAALLAPGWALAELKVGIVEMQTIISDSVPGAQAMEELRGRFEDMKGELDVQNESITKMRDDLQRQGMVLSQEAKQDKELEYRRKVRDFQDQYQAFQRKMQAEEERLSEPILEVLLEVIEKYGQDNGFSMIIDGAGAGLVYADDALIITDQVIEALNQAWQDSQN